MTTQNVDGYTGKEWSLRVNGIKIAAVQDFKYTATQDVELLEGAGFEDPHALIASGRAYKFSFSIKQLNKAVLDPVVDASRAEEFEQYTFELDGQKVDSLLDLRNLNIKMGLPKKNNYLRAPEFIDCRLTKDEGGFSLSDKILGRSFEGVARKAKGLL